MTDGLREKVLEAIRAYEQQGVSADVLKVHPSTAKSIRAVRFCGLKVVEDEAVSPEAAYVMSEVAHAQSKDETGRLGGK